MLEEWDFLDEDFEKEKFEDTFTIVVIHDIISNKRRTYFHKLLKAFGYNIQKSAFECILTREKAEILFKSINKFAQEEDLIRIYKLNQNVKTIIYGKKLEEDSNEFYFL